MSCAIPGLAAADRVVVLADIHGHAPALDAVLAEPDVASADLIVLNGDLADGPFPSETLDRLEALGSRALWLRGNGDRWLSEARADRFRHADPAIDSLLRWAADQLSDERLARLVALPLTAKLDITGLGRVAICHATARSDNEMLLVDSPIEQARAAFADLDAELVIVGHSHMPFDRLFDRRRVVNAGSVGLPDGHAGASWVLLGSDVVLRRTLYDVQAAADLIRATNMPDADDFVRSCVLTTDSDAEALDAFRIILKWQQREHEHR